MIAIADDQFSWVERGGDKRTRLTNLQLIAPIMKPYLKYVQVRRNRKRDRWNRLLTKIPIYLLSPAYFIKIEEVNMSSKILK